MNDRTRLAPGSIGPPDLLMILRSLWAGKWLIVSAIAIALLLAAVYLLATEARYAASAIVSLKGPEQKVVNFDEAAGGLPPEQLDRMIETEVNLLRSHGLTRWLVEEYSLLDDPEFNSQLQPGFSLSGWLQDRLGRFTGFDIRSEPSPQEVLAATIDNTAAAISVAAIPDTLLIRVRVQSVYPEKAAELANGLARAYLDQRLESQLASADEAADWLGRQVNELQTNLAQSEDKQTTLETATRATSSENLARQNGLVERLREKYVEIQAKIDLSGRRVAVLEEIANGLTPELTGSLAEDPILAPVLYRGGSPDAPSLNEAAIAELLAQEQLTKERQTRSASTLSAAIAELEQQIESQSGDLVELQQLTRETEANAAVYEYALARVKELAVERGLRQSGARIVSKAEPPLMPSSASSGMVAALAASLGAMAGVGIILFRQQMHDVFRTAEDVDNLAGVPVVGQIPRLPVRGPRRALEHIAADETSLFSEAVRNVRISILSKHRNDGMVVVLASALPGEGKTTLAVALARSMSLIGKRVLVIDADLRRRSLARYFGRKGSEAGLAAVLLHERPFSEVVVHEEAIGADLLFSEESPQNAADLLSLDAFQRLVERAKQAYDVVIIDTPAALAVPDVKLIAPFADTFLLVLQWNRTSRLQFLDFVRELESTNATVSGCLLSQIDPKGLSRMGYGDRRGDLAAYRAGYFH